jgi:hypothetical protein
MNRSVIISTLSLHHLLFTHFPSILFTYSSDPNLNLSGKPTFFSNFHSCLHMKPCDILMKSGLTTTIGFINETGVDLVLKTNESEKGILSCAMQ